MSELIVYHGGTEVVERPICHHGRPNLDFGQGFYVTDIRQQAEDWATQVAARRTLKRLSQHQPNNQMCLLSQEITDKYLMFDGAEAI